VHKRIAILGPESTGKSWLSQHLAEHYDTAWIKEYAREYFNRSSPEYNLSDIENIAAQQFTNNLAEDQRINKYLFADTEMLVCYIWASFVFGKVPVSIAALAQQQHFDLYLLCNVDLAWESDPLREHPFEREILFNHYLEEIKKRGWPFFIVNGKGKERLETAISAIEQLTPYK
jgi:NadR type nicotinamide-nucleotide adenylyltransferase